MPTKDELTLRNAEMREGAVGVEGEITGLIAYLQSPKFLDGGELKNYVNINDVVPTLLRIRGMVLDVIGSAESCPSGTRAAGSAVSISS